MTNDEQGDAWEPAMTVADACADALLTACANVIVSRGVEPTFPEVQKEALHALNRVVSRTLVEGARL